MMISVVIPLYNKEQSIARTLQSVIGQSYREFEVIVVDDGSTDNSVLAVETFITRCSNLPIPIRLIKKSNGGVCSARNKGITEALGEYIALLDGDDLWHKDFLQEQIKLIAEFPDAMLYGTNFELVSTDKTTQYPTDLPKGFRGYVENYFEHQHRGADLFCSSSVVIKKKAFEVVGYFDERIKYAEDTDMWFRLAATFPVVFYDKVFAYYQQETENRAMKHTRLLKYFLPYYVSKYDGYKQTNYTFYVYIQRWSACRIKEYYFCEPAQHTDAKQVTEYLDYAVLPKKYRLLFSLPYPMAKVLYFITERHLKLKNR